jgi:hypothetical protein
MHGFELTMWLSNDCMFQGQINKDVAAALDNPATFPTSIHRHPLSLD